MGLTVSHKKKLIIVTVSRKMATILTVCRKSHHTFATLNKAKDMSTWCRDHSDARNILCVP